MNVFLWFGGCFWFLQDRRSNGSMNIILEIIPNYFQIDGSACIIQLWHYVQVLVSYGYDIIYKCLYHTIMTSYTSACIIQLWHDIQLLVSYGYKIIYKWVKGVKGGRQDNRDNALVSIDQIRSTVSHKSETLALHLDRAAWNRQSCDVLTWRDGIDARRNPKTRRNGYSGRTWQTLLSVACVQLVSFRSSLSSLYVSYYLIY